MINGRRLTMALTILSLVAIVALSCALGPAWAQPVSNSAPTPSQLQHGIDGGANDDYLPPTTKSEFFDESADKAVAALNELRFGRRLSSVSLGAASDTQLAERVRIIKAGSKLAEVSLGDRDLKHDVILQPGHYGRTSGATGTSGIYVPERDIAAYIVGIAATKLRSEGKSVLVVPADGVTSGVKGKLFLSIHADGSIRQCSTGPSLGYDRPKSNSAFAMHAIGWALASAMGYRYDEFRKDNFTANEASYYMFRKVSTDALSGLVEIGELTCRTTEEQLIVSSNAIGTNLAIAIKFILETHSLPDAH